MAGCALCVLRIATAAKGFENIFGLFDIVPVVNG
jgi:hypothetical protein